MKIDNIIKEVLKKGNCPDCNKKADKCKCNFPELYVTVKINNLRKILQKCVKEREGEQ